MWIPVQRKSNQIKENQIGIRIIKGGAAWACIAFYVPLCSDVSDEMGNGSFDTEGVQAMMESANDISYGISNEKQ